MSQRGSLGSSGSTPPTPFTPNQTIQEFDDFLTTGGKFNWTNGGIHDGTDTNPGITQNAGPGIFMNLSDGPFVLGEGSLSMNWVVDLAALSDNTNTYVIYLGLADFTSFQTNMAPTDGVYFQYTDTVNTGHWQIACTDSSVTTIHNTSTLAATGFHNFGITINAAATSVAFFINGVQVANSPITTNITTNPIMPGFNIITSAGSAPSSLFDLWYYTQTLTVAR